MKIPARCNQRLCQQDRRNLSQPLKHYRFRPGCHVPGCKGLMYVDSYRLKARQDRALRHRGEYVEQIVANPSVHSPFKLGKETHQDWDLYGKDIPVDRRSFGQY